MKTPLPLLLVSLAASPAILPAQDPPAGVQHRLVRFIDGGENIQLPASPSITLRFEKERRISGRAPVNLYFGAFHLAQDGKLNWALPGFGSTMMAGPEDLMVLEFRYFKALASARLLTVTQTGVLFESEDRATVLEFAATSPQNVINALTGRRLFLARMIAEGREIELPSAPLILLTLEAEGRVQGFAGVNNYRGGYVRTGENEIAFSAFAVTRRAGPPELMRIEDLYLRALLSAREWSPSLNGAVLRSADGSFVLEFAAGRE